MQPNLDPERGYFNKWEIYKLLKLHSIKSVKIPETKILNKNSLASMLVDYPLLFIKSIATWGGKDISTIEKSGNHFIWKIQGGDALNLIDFEEAYDHIHQFYHNKNAIIQRGIPVIYYRECPFDIRAHLFRDTDASWVYAGDLARIGGKGSLVSNIEISNGTVKPTEEIVISLFSEQNQNALIEILRTASLEICIALDQYHFFDEVGIDFALDPNGNIWIIEVNTNDAIGGPDHNLFSLLPDQSVYNRIMHHKSMIFDKWIHDMVNLFEEYRKEKDQE